MSNQAKALPAAVKAKPGSGIDVKRALEKLAENEREIQIEVLEKIHNALTTELSRVRQ
ncbi:hypothetical protein [Arcanobacterium hippocoleae]|uniref:Uncharacterized protein n=1 Tax=Arcanobacterium hippocoleae TaxID=149017 RepID=A0ABU1SZP2_9ACTO|nr:hypothetical protein [Arcanobacterium hippocoleae]MDR6938602.1 hypothetical protein [Arcanobacterium hippocoleae]